MKRSKSSTGGYLHSRCIFNMHVIQGRVSLQSRFINITLPKTFTHSKCSSSFSGGVEGGADWQVRFIPVCSCDVHFPMACQGEVKQTWSDSLDRALTQRYQIALIHTKAQISEVNNHEIALSGLFAPLISLPFKHSLPCHGWRRATSQLYPHSTGWH